MRCGAVATPLSLDGDTNRTPAKADHTWNSAEILSIFAVAPFGLRSASAKPSSRKISFSLKQVERIVAGVPIDLNLDEAERFSGVSAPRIEVDGALDRFQEIRRSVECLPVKVLRFVPAVLATSMSMRAR
jgi:hypothetical protein